MPAGGCKDGLIPLIRSQGRAGQRPAPQISQMGHRARHQRLELIDKTAHDQCHKRIDRGYTVKLIPRFAKSAHRGYPLFFKLVSGCLDEPPSFGNVAGFSVGLPDAKTQRVLTREGRMGQV